MAVYNAKNSKCDWETLPYIIQLHHPIHKLPELYDAFEGGIVVMAVQSLKIKSHLQWVLKEMDTNLNM